MMLCQHKYSTLKPSEIQAQSTDLLLQEPLLNAQCRQGQSTAKPTENQAQSTVVAVSQEQGPQKPKVTDLLL